jgi:hypothetical protein
MHNISGKTKPTLVGLATLLGAILFLAELGLWQVMGVQLLTPMTLLLWLAGLAWLVANLARLNGFTADRTSALLAAALPLFTSLYLAPHLYQSFYWLFAPLAWQAVSAKATRLVWLVLMLLAPLSFIAGGFSESACACLVTALALYLVMVMIGAGQHRQVHL